MSSTPAPVRKALKSQYHAALKMLEQTIENCPDPLWADSTPTNPYWLVAYHALFFTHLYLVQNEAAFRPWEKHRPGYQSMEQSREKKPYSKAELLEYCGFCTDMIDQAIDTLDLDHPESGFSWYQVPKLEHQLVNIRHLQHHTAQLADRLRNADGLGTRWVKNG